MNFIKAFTFNMLWNSGLADIYAENSALHECVVRKGEEYFNALSDNCVCSSLITMPKLSKWKFLKDYSQCGIWKHIRELFIVC